MRSATGTRALCLRARYRDGAFEGEACLLIYDDDSFGDLLVSGDIKEVFERRAATANIFIAAPYLSSVKCRETMLTGSAVQRATAYLSGKTGNLFLIELHRSGDAAVPRVHACPITWDAKSGTTVFGVPQPLDASLREGWMFDLFDRNDGLVVAPPGVHFRKSSSKHTTTFLRAANALTCSAACGLLALFAIEALMPLAPRRILVDTAPLLSLAFATMAVARANDIWSQGAPAKSFSSYGGMRGMGRLSPADVVLVSATTSGSMVQELMQQGARADRVVTLYFLAAGHSPRPGRVLCDLTVAANKSFGYQPTANFDAADCTLCRSQHLLAELEGDQFLLQARQHRLLKVLKKTQSDEARDVLTELHAAKALRVAVCRAQGQVGPIVVDEARLLSLQHMRADMVRLMRRFCPQPLGLVVRLNISVQQVNALAFDAGIAGVVEAAKTIDWVDLPTQPPLADGAGVLVLIGCLSSQTQARSVNASLRAIVNDGNVSYISGLTLAETPEQYRDLKTFLNFGSRGADTFTYREARRLALPGPHGFSDPWEEERQFLSRLQIEPCPELDARREWLSSSPVADTEIFLPGLHGPLAIQRDFVYLDTNSGDEGFSQAVVFAVVMNLLCAARSNDRELGAKETPKDVLELAQSVYGHVLIHPSTFLNYNDAILKASVLRAARASELMYEVDENFSRQMAEIAIAELDGWSGGKGDAWPEMLLAFATRRLRLRESDRLDIRQKALSASLPPLLNACARAI